MQDHASAPPGVNTTGFDPIMEEEDVKKLSTLSLDGLEKLAKKYGELTGTCVCCRTVEQAFHRLIVLFGSKVVQKLKLQEESGIHLLTPTLNSNLMMKKI